MKFDILHIHENKSTLQIEGNSVNALKNSDIKRYGVRRFEDGKQFQTSRLGNATENLLLAESKKWGGPGTPYDCGFAPAHTEKRNGFAVSTDIIASFEDYAKQLIEQYPHFVFSGKCIVNSTATSLKSNYGLDLQTSGGHCEWYLLYQRKGSGNMFDGYVSETAAISKMAEEIEAHKEILNAYDKVIPLKSGRMPVLFLSPETPLDKLVESFSVRRYFENSCLYAGKLNEQIFSPEVTLVDKSYEPQWGSNQFFDGEGIVRTNDSHTLIHNGRFVGLISDLRFGKKYDQASTGNGLRNYNTGINLATRSLRFQPGSTSWREVLKNLNHCLIVMIAAGGDSNDLGEFSTPVQIGYIYEKGELVGRAPQVTIKTSVSDCLGKDLIAITSDGFSPNAPSPCLIAEMDVLVN